MGGKMVEVKAAAYYACDLGRTVTPNHVRSKHYVIYLLIQSYQLFALI